MGRCTGVGRATRRSQIRRRKFHTPRGSRTWGLADKPALCVARNWCRGVSSDTAVANISKVDSILIRSEVKDGEAPGSFGSLGEELGPGAVRRAGYQVACLPWMSSIWTKDLPPQT